MKDEWDTSPIHDPTISMPIKKGSKPIPKLLDQTVHQVSISVSLSQVEIPKKAGSSNKYEHPTINAHMFDWDLPLSKGISSNILSMSEQIGIQGLTTLCEEPPRYVCSPTPLKMDNTLGSFSIQWQNKSPQTIDEECDIFPHPLIVYDEIG